ncbi:SdpI family protein [Clostridium cellulovorans]|uniref:SdpI/YhfL protein family n=1 Tax=Clostridium cellulovorans (strain ATCC 35296 / DSM 3052 / OCM 3 / 743B) TaxID=573061 RepID=D9SN80_CLOC7|nr:SdpI family protein [Clostridium cellulovorans]ADL53872.1 hypothetical protein Clocel_4211 [Clostridium cellulovorans 743B]
MVIYYLPSLFIIVGVFWSSAPPKDKNGLIGIKLPLAKESDENWIETHKYAGKVLIVLGTINIIIEYVIKFTTLKEFINSIPSDQVGLYITLQSLVNLIIVAILSQIHLIKVIKKRENM